MTMRRAMAEVKKISVIKVEYMYDDETEYINQMAISEVEKGNGKELSTSRYEVNYAFNMDRSK